MFHNQSKFLKKKQNNIIATKNIWIWNYQRFVLNNKMTIVYKKNKDWNLFLDSLFIFQRYKELEKDIE